MPNSNSKTPNNTSINKPMSHSSYIDRLDNQPKPQPRKKRNIRAKSIKVGK